MTDADRPVAAVVFDWGGTLTPYHDIDLLDLWRVAARRLAPDRAEELAEALLAAEDASWARSRTTERSATIDEVVAAAGGSVGLALTPDAVAVALEEHVEAWTPHTLTDPDAGGVLRELRGRGLRTGLLSNTHWPRAWHERFLERDGVLDLIDVRVYTSELQHVKPHPEAFRAVLDRLGVSAAATVFVGDRPRDDIFGAQRSGLRAVLLPNRGVPAYDVEPDARIAGLAELLPLLAAWSAG